MKRTVILDLILTSCGLATISYSLAMLRRVLEIRRWPFVPAEIKGGDIFWDFSSGHATRRIKLSYIYTVDGRSFENQRVTVSDYFLAGGELMLRVIAKKHILPGPKAYYCPRDPSQAVLVRPGFGLPITLATMGLALLVTWYSCRDAA
jgi:hypothetical protein